jgi:hypothetical protein
VFTCDVSGEVFGTDEAIVELVSIQAVSLRVAPVASVAPVAPVAPVSPVAPVASGAPHRVAKKGMPSGSDRRKAQQESIAKRAKTHKLRLMRSRKSILQRHESHVWF